MAKQGLTIDWTGMRCARCSYVRRAQDVGDACPACQAPYIDERAAPQPATGNEWFWTYLEAMAAAWRDPSFYALLAVNVGVLWYAFAQHLSVRGLMLLYWLQGAIICACNVVRILELRRFSTDGMKADGHPLEETPETRRGTAFASAIFFFSFYNFYLFGILFPPEGRGGPLGPLAVYALCVLVYALNHIYSLRKNIARDARGRPSIDTLMVMPWLRIMPMHVIVLPGIFIDDSTAALVFFGIVKTFFDCSMHAVEHHVLSREAVENPG